MSKRSPVRTDEKTRELALTVLAECSGNVRHASARLEDADIEVAPSTLQYWKAKSHKEDYARIRSTVLPRLRQEAQDQWTELGQVQREATYKLACRLRDESDQLETRDVPRALQAVATTAGISTDKVEMLSGNLPDRPTQSPEEIMRSLANKGVNVKMALEISQPSEDTPKAVANLGQ